MILYTPNKLLFYIKNKLLYNILNMSTTIIELNENGPDSINYDSGDYKIILKEPIVLKKNSVVKLKSAYIDAVAPQNNSQIIVPPDTPGGKTATLGISVGYYYLDWGCSIKDQAASGDDAGGDAGGDDGSNKNFVMFKDSAAPAVALPTSVRDSCLPFILNQSNEAADVATKNTFEINGITCNLAFPVNNGTNPNGIYGLAVRVKSAGVIKVFGLGLDAGNATVKKYAVAGVLRLNTESLKEMTAAGGVTGFPPRYTHGAVVPTAIHFTFAGDITMPLQCQQQSPIGAHPNDFEFIGISETDNTGFPLLTTLQSAGPGKNLSAITKITSVETAALDPGTITNTLYTQDINFEIPALTYQCQDLAEVISLKLGDIELTKPTPTSTITNEYQLSFNPLLKTSRQIQFEPNFAPHGDGKGGFFSPYKTGHSQFKFVTSKVPAANPTNVDVNYVFGSSQFGLIYDAEHDKMKLAQIHNHLYDTTVKSKNLDPQIRMINSTDGIAYADRCCGVFLTDLRPAGFWHGDNSQLKFGDDIISKVVKKNALTAGGAIVKYDHVELIPGVNCTSDEMGLDDLITKQRITNGFDVAQSTTGVVINSTQQQVGINAQSTISPSNNVADIKKQGGYFKLEVGIPSLQQDLRAGGDKNNNIQAIISRFYHDGNYTSSYDEGSIPIVYNRDDESYVDSFSVRILGPDGQIARPLGNTSSIFIEIDTP